MGLRGWKSSARSKCHQARPEWKSGIQLGWKELNPECVKRHNHHLKRLGFQNNAHANGVF
jgi:hypothetical protein